MVSDQRLRNVSCFRNLPASALEAIAARLRLLRFEEGSLVFRKGDPSDALYLVESGRVDVVLDDGAIGGDEEPLASLGPGSFVGELGLLLDEPRSATLVAAADSQLWSLGRSDLDALLVEHPVIAVDLSRELGRRLVATNARLTRPVLTRFTAVWGNGTAELATGLVAAGCGRVGVVALSSSTPLPPLSPEVSVIAGGRERDAATVAGWAGRRVEGLDHLLLVLPPTPSAPARRAAILADHLVVFEGGEPAWVTEPMGRHRVLRCDGSSATLRRAVRWISGRAVGLALSSGGSKCVAHLGVIRVLRAMGVEIDAVAGTSGGALAGAGVAFGLSEAEMVRLVRLLAQQTRLHRFDFNLLPRSALFKGVRLRAFFDNWMGGRSFSDAHVPFWVVAADVESAEEVVIGEGPVADGLRASMSIPVALNPWLVDGRLLIDGAVVNPMPANVLRDAGLRVVIGSTVAGQERPARQATNRVPHMLQIVSRMINAMEREMIGAQASLVDVLIRPRVYASNSFDFSRLEAFVDEGERAAQERMADIERVIQAPRR